MDLIQPFCAVLLVLGLLGGTLFYLKNKGAASFHLPRRASVEPRRIEVLERLALGPQHALHLVRVGNRTVVVATGPSSCQLLCEESQ